MTAGTRMSPPNPSRAAGFVAAQRHNNDRYGDPRPGSEDVAAGRKGFAALPGTETGLRIGGFIKLSASCGANPAGARDWFVPATIPVTATHKQRGPQFGMTARASQLNVEFRRSTGLVYGTNRARVGSKGDAARLIFSARYSFAR